MGLPPATPTPTSRFLAPRRLNASSQQSHPRYQSPAIQRQDANGAPAQFYATPRFSSSSKPPASSDKVAWTSGATFSALALKTKTPSNNGSTQDIIDSSPDSPQKSLPVSPLAYNDELPEPIEFPSSLIPESPSQGSPGFEVGRSPKRRRISIASTESDLTSRIDFKKESDGVDHIPSSSFPDDITFIKSEDENSIDNADEKEQHYDQQYPSDDSHGAEYFLNINRKRKSDLKEHQKPTFFDPPPFKPTDYTDGPQSHHFPPQEHLTDIFSPSKRRGAKYVPGGLAAELRDWLVDVKTESEKRSSSTRIAQLTVDSLRNGGSGMTLVSGQSRPKIGAGRIADDPPGPSNEPFRAILVGDGGLIEDQNGGLDKSRSDKAKEHVGPGAVVGIVPPVWDVDLPGQGNWAVAYRWEVVGEASRGVGGEMQSNDIT